MPTLTWTDDLALAHPQMDATHQEFVDLLGAAETALAQSPEAALAAYESLVEHTVAHFAQEDRWMIATGFAPENCHTRQHTTVLTLMREVVRLAREEASWQPLGVLLHELALWFPQHALMMDAGLAQHMTAVGFDVVTGQINGALPEHAITRCGSVGCHS